MGGCPQHPPIIKIKDKVGGEMRKIVLGLCAILIVTSTVGCIDHDYLLVAKKEYEIKHGLSASPQEDTPNEEESVAPNVHKPYLDRQCTDCHVSVGSIQVVAEGNKLCYLCHEESMDRWESSAFVHPALQNWECSDCHDPHDSRWAYHLASSEETLCTNCHELQLHPEIEQNRLIQHLPAQRGKCIFCHDPHGSDEDHLLKNSAKELCQSCHNVKSRGKQALSLDCQQDCLLCHTPHASSYQGRLRAQKPGGDLSE